MNHEDNEETSKLITKKKHEDAMGSRRVGSGCRQTDPTAAFGTTHEDISTKARRHDA